MTTDPTGQVHGAVHDQAEFAELTARVREVKLQNAILKRQNRRFKRWARAIEIRRRNGGDATDRD